MILWFKKEEGINVGIQRQKSHYSCRSGFGAARSCGSGSGHESGPEKIDIAEQLSLGEKYLLEMDYEKAILAFNKVIKVDPRNVKAYLGLADAYVGTGDIDKAIKTLKKGLKLTGDESIRAKLERLKIRKNAASLLEPLYQAFADGDREAATALMQSEEYIALSGSAVYEEPYYYGKTLEGNTRNGMGLGCYSDNYYYYGQWENDVRSGKGLWIRVVHGDDSALESYTYEGNWKNDLPNGQGSIYLVIDETRLEKEEDHTYALYTESTGIFKDGYYDGVFSITWNMDSGEIHHWTPTYNDGIGQAMQGAAMWDDGSYHIALCDNCEANLCGSETELNRVLGFSD